VLLVRARILQRLRGVPLSANRSMLTVICNLEFSKDWSEMEGREGSHIWERAVHMW